MIFIKNKKENIIFSIFCLAVGAMMILWPGESLQLLVRLVGVVVLVYGVGMLIICTHSPAGARLSYMLSIVASLLFGLWLLASPWMMIKLIPVLVGFVLFFCAVRNFILGGHLPRGTSSKQFMMISAVVMLVFGVLLILRPWSAMKVAMIITGCALVYNGIVRLLSLHTKDDYIDVDYKEL